MTRRQFMCASMSCAAAASSAFAFAEDAVPSSTAQGIRLRFLGSGASGWKPEWLKDSPHMRRQSSVLLENRVLIDFTSCSFDHLPEGCRPEALFQTHSHGDHYNPSALVRVGVKRLYVHESWAATARAEVAAQSELLKMPAPEVIALSFAKPVREGDLLITAVPANHSTSLVTEGVLEKTCLYLVEKGLARLLYATDTGGIPGDAARMIGIDAHVSERNYPERFAGNPYVSKPKPITALVMEATDGDLDDDFRMFVHSSAQLVARTVSALKRTKRYLPPEGQSAYITHLGIKYRGWACEKIEAELPEGIKAAADGMELVLG